MCLLYTCVVPLFYACVVSLLYTCVVSLLYTCVVSLLYTCVVSLFYTCVMSLLYTCVVSLLYILYVCPLLILYMSRVPTLYGCRVSCPYSMRVSCPYSIRVSCAYSIRVLCVVSLLYTCGVSLLYTCRVLTLYVCRVLLLYVLCPYSIRVLCPYSMCIVSSHYTCACSKYDDGGAGDVEVQDEELCESHDCALVGCQRIIINVSGQKYETQLRTLNRYPETLLGDPLKRKQFWDSRRNEFFIDRHRPSFQAILYFYQSGGRLRRPIEVPEDIFVEELEFYQFSEDVILEYKVREGFVMEVVKELPTEAWQRKIWLFCEEPDSSRAAKLFAIVSVICILISIVSFCVETLPQFERDLCQNTTILENGGIEIEINFNDVFFVLEAICVSWFTAEFVMRLVSCPSKMTFCKNIMNIFDLLAILPFFVSLVMLSSKNDCDAANTGSSFIIVRVLRVFRVFKLSKHSQGLRILGLTIKSSLRELGMFFFFLVVAMVIFSSAAYYAEVGEPDSQLTSIPGGFWWAIVTMTTVGYGDVTPVGVWGKIVGAFCVVAGVLTIALPVPVVVANFNNFYKHESGHGYISS